MHGLTPRQTEALDQLFFRGRLSLADLEERFPSTHRRT